MTKRTTEQVLEAEVDRCDRDVERARLAVEKAKAARVAADKAEGDAELKLDDALGALRRAEAALAAFLPGELETLVDQAKERQRTTGTHDPTEDDAAATDVEIPA